MDTLTVERAGRLLPTDSTRSALVIGDLMVDRYIIGAVDRVSPEAPVPVVHVRGERSVVGGAGNVAMNLSALGLRCTVVGITGEDPAGAELRGALEGAGVRTDGLVTTPHRGTTVKTRVVAGHQQIVRFDHESTEDVTGRPHDELVARIDDLVADHDVVVVGDYDKGVVTDAVAEALLRSTADRGIATVIDPKRRRFFAFPGATVFKPNAKELTDAFGEAVRSDDEEWMEEARTRIGCEHLVLTLGPQGIAVKSPECGLVRVPAVAREVFDVSGAGDTVSAVVGAVLAEGGTPVEAAALANHAAAVCISRPGVVPVSRTEVLESVSREGVTKTHP